MAGSELTFACTCGTVRGALVGASATEGTRAECFCADCRASEIYARQPDPAPNGVQLFQAMPDQVRFDAGHEQLAVFSLSEKGLLRWQAKCCGAIMFFTMRSPKIPFASIRTDRLTDPDALGPVIARAFVRKPNGKVGHDRLGTFIYRFASRAVSRRISGKWKNTPFFDAESLKPVADIYVLSKDERKAATAA
ncbi:DUF6151 family protein [Tateyamaria sp.]|uniref:DUF6151 family protein n=1 Tax=Tateyamaria sp. TaxID=1929288 RepID=UPI00329F12AB